MSQFCTDPAREFEPTALPDAEVCELSEGEMMDESGYPLEAGWYWWACFPGCLPDGEPNGPFDTEEDAMADAREEITEDEEEAPEV